MTQSNEDNWEKPCYGYQGAGAVAELTTKFNSALNVLLYNWSAILCKLLHSKEIGS